MPAGKASYKFVRGPAHVLHGVKKGGEVELTEAEVIDLSQRSFVLEPTDGRRSIPEDAKKALEETDDKRTTTETLEKREAKKESETEGQE